MIPVKNEPPGSPRGKPKLPLPAHLAKGAYNTVCILNVNIYYFRLNREISIDVITQ